MYVTRRVDVANAIIEIYSTRRARAYAFTFPRTRSSTRMPLYYDGKTVYPNKTARFSSVGIANK